MRLFTVICVIGMCTRVSGCAGSPPIADHDYLLRPQTPAVGAVAGRSVVRLKPVAIPPYLDRNGMVLQTGASEIRVAKHHRWAEPLDDSIGRYLQVGIANQANVSVETASLTSGGEHDTVTVRINRFHGTEAGQVRLVADWSVGPSGGEPKLYSFDRSVTQSVSGYPALVDAHAELLDELAAAIARSLNGL
jgi:uncharacterized lipoprotein YmbA